MSTFAALLSSDGVELVLQRVDEIEFGWGGLDEPGPQTESAIERGFRRAGPIDDEWGLSSSLDPDNIGEIADEGAGHRG